MKNKGFTLVEVLVCVIIVMILATYSVLKYTETIYEGENRKAKAQMEVIAGAYNRYLMEYPEDADALSGKMYLINDDCAGKKADGSAGKFACGKQFLGGKYEFFLGKPTNLESPACDSSFVTMKPKEGAKVGAKYESGYCAYIDRFGRAKDGTVSAAS